MESDLDICCCQLTEDDRRVVLSAIGWYELDNDKEALAELEQLPGTLAQSFEVMSVRHAIALRNPEDDYSRAEGIGVFLMKRYPEQISSHLRMASTWYLQRRFQEAYTVLFNLARNAIGHLKLKQLGPEVPYNIACYLCRLGRASESVSWMHVVYTQDRELFAHGYDDEDLAPLWTLVGGKNYAKVKARFKRSVTILKP
jgi:hypothetical protein